MGRKVKLVFKQLRYHKRKTKKTDVELVVLDYRSPTSLDKISPYLRKKPQKAQGKKDVVYCDDPPLSQILHFPFLVSLVLLSAITSSSKISKLSE